MPPGGTSYKIAKFRIGLQKPGSTFDMIGELAVADVGRHVLCAPWLVPSSLRDGAVTIIELSGVHFHC